MIKNNLKPIVSIALVIMLVLIVGIRNVQAQYTTTDITGWAWSDNIGWISLSCKNTNSCATSNYGVTLSQGQFFSGYAWSDNIGWISFNGVSRDVLAQAVLGSDGKYYDTHKWGVSGTANALAADNNGWDGRIVMAGSWSPGVYMDYHTGAIAGWAWGGDVVGWVQMMGQFNGSFGTTPTTTVINLNFK